VMLYRDLIGVGKCVARLDVSLAYKIRYRIIIYMKI
jgi:hypothetical protein